MNSSNTPKPKKPPKHSRDAWSEGYEAAIDFDIDKNPYNQKTESDFHVKWRSGWYDRMYQNPEDNYCGGY